MGAFLRGKVGASAFAATLAGLLAGAAATADTYYVGAPGTVGECTHSSVQAAVDAAAASAGLDEIRIAAQQSFTDQAVVIDDQDLTIAGGFDGCRDMALLQPAVLSGAGGATAPVIRIQGDGDVSLLWLEIREGDAFSWGGGIFHEGTGRVVVEHCRIVANHAGNGAGIAMLTSSTTARGELHVGDGTVIEDNEAKGFGGGINVANGALYLGGAGTSVRHNSAGLQGGGLAVTGIADVGSGGIGDEGVLFANEAGFRGGAVSVGMLGDVRIFTTDPDRPVRINGNRADVGGAFHLDGQLARLRVWQGQILDNHALSDGGAIRIDNRATAELLRDLATGPAPDSAVACAPTHACNLIAGNRAQSDMGVSRDGAVATVWGVPTGATSSMTIESATIRANDGESLFMDGCDGTACGQAWRISASEISGNTAHRIARHAGGEVAIDLVTIAGNSLVADVFAGEASLRLSRSIVWQPGTTLWAVTNPPADPGHLLLHDVSAFPKGPDIIAADPRFVDATSGDFQLLADSPALDIAPDAALPPADLGDGLRSVDLPFVGNLDGPVDLGAYEHRPAGDQLFQDGFEAG